MVKPALIEHRPWLLASVTMSIAYYFLSDNQADGGFAIGGVWLMLLKGACVGFLALYAWRRTSGTDGVILVLVLVLSALGDMALAMSSQEDGVPSTGAALDPIFLAGGALFAASHIAAVVLYLRNRRSSTTASQKMLGAALLIAAPAGTYVLTKDPMITLYAVLLGAMTATAWTSRFPRYRVGIGAILFMVSDWLIFSDFGAFDLAPLPDLLIWPVYFAAQLLIATGVVQTLRGELPAK